MNTVTYWFANFQFLDIFKAWGSRGFRQRCKSSQINSYTFKESSSLQTALLHGSSIGECNLARSWWFSSMGMSWSSILFWFCQGCRLRRSFTKRKRCALSSQSNGASCVSRASLLFFSGSTTRSWFDCVSIHCHTASDLGLENKARMVSFSHSTQQNTVLQNRL